MSPRNVSEYLLLQLYINTIRVFSSEIYSQVALTRIRGKHVKARVQEKLGNILFCSGKKQEGSLFDIQWDHCSHERDKYIRDIKRH